MEKSNYIELNPNEIEAKSFRIITAELGHLSMPEEMQAILKRVVHTTADFDYARITEIHSDAVRTAKEAIAQSCNIYADTNMILAGVSKPSLKKYGCSIYTYVDHPDVAAQSKELGITRSILGINKAAEDPKTQIYVIGNAPTALVRLYELIRVGRINPALIIGVPVGFVGAAESKDLIKETNVPYIVTNGRKGGSTVAVAILNAILYQ